MKDLVISKKRIKTEILTWSICFLIANLLNLYAILTHNESSVIEMITSIGYVFVLSLSLYFFWVLIRIIFYGLKCLMLTSLKRNP